MKLLTLKESGLTTSHSKFKQSSLLQLTVAFVFACLIVGFLLWYKSGGSPLKVIIGPCGLFFVFVLVSFFSFKKTLAPSNWVLGISPGRIHVKFRSYLNAHFPESDPQIILLHPSEINSANITKLKVTEFGFSGRRQTSIQTVLDLHVADSELSSLNEQLVYEQNLKPQPQGKYIKSSSRSNHQPIAIIDSRIIRITWRSPVDRIIPGICKAIRWIEDMGITIEPLHKEVIDLTLTSADKKGLEENIIRFAERGEILKATTLTRKVYNLSLAEAKLFVEELVDKG